MSSSRLLPFLIALLLLGFVACSGSRATTSPISTGTTARAPAPAPVAVPVPAPVASGTLPAVQAQIDRGVMLFAQNCASCHGARGQGSASAPAVVGEGTLPLDPPAGARLRTVRFESAMDLGLFIKDNMPVGGQHLPPSDVACVLAWLLQQHGRTPTQPISPVTAAAIRR